MIVVPGYHDPKQNQTPSAAKKKDFVTLVDVAGKEHTINVRANGERLQLGAIAEIELQAGDRLWLGPILLASPMAHLQLWLPSERCRIMTSPHCEKVLSMLDRLLPELEHISKNIHAHPELSMQEIRTSRLAADHLRAAGTK